VKRPVLILGALLLLQSPLSRAQTAPPIPADALGMHNFTLASGSGVVEQGSLGCTFCHAPHSGLGGITPLWNQTLSLQSYTPYTSTTYKQQGNTQPLLGRTSSLCLSCHDGTVAIGQSAVYGKIPVTGSMNNMDVLGVNLSSSHPFSLILPIKDAPDLAVTLASQGATADPTGAVKLINGNIECTSCHDPHIQAIDPIAQDFLVRNGSSGQICLACHDPNRVVTGQSNLLNGWTGSIHSTATNQVASGANVGPYTTIAANACGSCHAEHNANGPRLVRLATPAAPGVDPTTQDCITCHYGGTNISPAAPNVYAEFAKISHPLPAGNNTHDEGEPAILNNNRHSTCVDCHSPHAANQLSVFAAPPAIRPPQNNVTGVSGVDGVTVLTPAVNQFESCLRCHGTSAGKQVLIKYGYLPNRLVFAGDPLNLVPQFSINSTSSHPVTHDSNSPLPQPSLLVNMLNLNGTTSARLVATRIFCTDCHNSDDNREFGGTGPNGPHGSTYPHVLERNYQFGQTAVPGGPVTNLYPNPDLSPQGPYALCAKCHSLSTVLSSASWPLHVNHVTQDGFACSICHTAHGMGATSASVTGERLINFDVGVVAQNGSTPISYNRAMNTCTLVCHGEAHNSTGAHAAASPVAPRK
jgi:predicted CXXCH cytochrome family protein